MAFTIKFSVIWCTVTITLFCPVILPCPPFFPESPLLFPCHVCLYEYMDHVSLFAYSGFHIWQRIRSVWLSLELELSVLVIFSTNDLIWPFCGQVKCYCAHRSRCISSSVHGHVGLSHNPSNCAQQQAWVWKRLGMLMLAPLGGFIGVARQNLVAALFPGTFTLISLYPHQPYIQPPLPRTPVS